MANGTRPFATLKNIKACGKVLIVPTLATGEAFEDQHADAQQKCYENYHDQDLDRYRHEAYKRYKAFNQNN
jgi:hypothetical protein